MRKIPTTLLAIISGVAVEATLCVISVATVLTGGIGPCGLTGDAPGFVRVVHQPGFWLAGALVADSGPLYLPLAVVFTTIFLSLVAWIVLRATNPKNPISQPTSEPGQTPPDHHDTI